MEQNGIHWFHPGRRSEDPAVRTPAQRILRSTVYLFAALLLLFGILISLLILGTQHGLKSAESDSGALLLTKLLEPFPEVIDDLYLKDIDTPMENLFSSSPFIGYCFSSTQYPPGPPLQIRLKKDLSTLTKSSDYIVSTFLYASSIDNYIADSYSTNISGSDDKGAFFRDIIYQYNSNTVEKSQIASAGHNTFLFRYQNTVIIAKDLVTLSGQSHATVFVVLDFARLGSFIFNSYRFVNPYSISIYDPNDNLLFSNRENGEAVTPEQLTAFSAGGTSVRKQNGNYLVYCHSGILQWSYILEVNQNYLHGQRSREAMIYLLTTFLALLFITVMSTALFRRVRTPVLSALDVLSLPEDASSGRNAVDAVSQSIAKLADENRILRRVVSSTSSDVCASMFSQLITGQHMEKEEIQATLDNTDYGFTMDDVTAAGVIRCEGTDYLDVEDRCKIQNMINATAEKFMERNECHVFAFAVSGASFAVIVAFPPSVSIAKGKSRVNDLIRLFEDSFSFSGLPLTAAFGHMYNSILDLSFSYKEAVSIRHPQNSNSTPVPAAGPGREGSAPAPDILPEAENAVETSAPDTSGTDTTAVESSLTPELINRRAAQITQLISDGREEDASGLTERILSDIFRADDASVRQENCKRLISALSDSIISHQFIDAAQLTDVYSDISRMMDDGCTSEEIRAGMQNAVNTLCTEFSEVLKKQRNPYIVAAMHYIEEHYSSPDLSLEEIADALRIAPNYLSTIFSRNLGKKLFEYVNEYRLQQSVQMLQNSDQMINEISIACGFGSARNYIRIFRKYMDTTPGAYRKQHTAAARESE